MAKIERFKNKHAQSKTLRNELRPIGKTEENFKHKMILEEDILRADSYGKVKELIDRYHKLFIDDVLTNIELQGLEEYYELYTMVGKDEKANDELEKQEEKLRKMINKAFCLDSRYKKLFKAELIRELLPEYFIRDDEKELIAQFNSFTTYFSGFNQNRENIYTSDNISTGIPHRCINVNLPKFLDNIKSYNKIKRILVKELEILEEEYNGRLLLNLDEVFKAKAYNLFLSQKGITNYNEIVGGYITVDGKVIKGINQYVNLYNQNKEKNERLPLLKPLFKQILSDIEKNAFVSEGFNTDQELLDTIRDCYSEENDNCIKKCINSVKELFVELSSFDCNGIYIVNDNYLSQISNLVFGDWRKINEGWNKEYDTISKTKNKENEKYYEERKKAFKSVKSMSISQIQFYGSGDGEKPADVIRCISDEIIKSCNSINENYDRIQQLVTEKYNKEKRLCKDEGAINGIKDFMDSIKNLEWQLKMLLGTGKEESKDDSFYGRMLPLYYAVKEHSHLYDKVRNYLTKKPYSKEKIKINFQNPQLLGGWDKNKERDYRTVLLRKDDVYYLAIMDKSDNKVFVELPYKDGDEYYEKMEYKLLPGPNKMLPKVFFAKSNIDYFNPSEKVLEIRKKESFKKGPQFSIDDCHTMIDFYKESINRHEDWCKFSFKFKDTKEYNDIGEFFKDVKEQAYSITFSKVSKAYIDKKVEEGKIYLFMIYNKDFSKFSKGTPNLHTLYFKMLFDNENLKNVVYQLNGGAEIFFRKASLIKDKPEHPAGIPIKNKNPRNEKKESIFRFDLYKDKRYMENKYFLHLPITMNFKADNVYSINNEVRRAIKESDTNYIIGIDRGERHLIYVSVINDKGEIVEQYSMNTIQSKHNGTEYITDYHKLLEEKEKGRKKSRQDWTTIENIKELKSGYLSQVIHIISQLVIKYDAIIAMEDLNSGFKNARKKVEKEVYQKFENMLTEKLSYLVNKRIDPKEDGGLLNAYQLTNKPGNLDKAKQDGIIMYVPAWLTSNIDPTTGFVDLLKPKISMTIEAAQKFYGTFKSIRYNKETDMFEFTFNYDDFDRGTQCYKKEWVVCSYGDRIRNVRDPEKNNKYISERIELTEMFKKLFDEYGISLEEDIRKAICRQTKKDFFTSLTKLFALTLQMRNSETGKEDVDYIISPVRNSMGVFFDSRNNAKDYGLPENADANGAYNIARKALYAVKVLKATEDLMLDKAKIYPTNKEWLEFAQRNG